MTAFHPLRTARRSGWRSRLALGLVIAGLLAGLIHAQRADAHLSGIHTVHVYGYMDIFDPDDGTSADETCNELAFDGVQTIDPKKSKKVSWSIKRQCDEVTGYFDLTIEVTKNGTKVSGVFRALEEDCALVCFTSEFKRATISGGAPDNSFYHYGPKTLENEDGRITGQFSVVVNT